MPAYEMPVVLIGEAAYPYDNVSIATYRWEDEGQRDHGPESGIVVSLGVYASRVFYQARERVIARSEFFRFRQDLIRVLEGQAETAAISTTGGAFSLRLSLQSG